MYDFEEDGKKPITFFIHDHDGDKVLEVDDHNWPDAYDSWLLLWQRKEGRWPKSLNSYLAGPTIGR